jgi:hypothetical protein
MDIRDARLLMKSLDVLIENANISLRVSHDYCDPDVHALVAALCADIVDSVDFNVRKAIMAKFPELKATGL